MNKIDYWHRQTLRDKPAEILKDWKEDRARLEAKVEKLTKCAEYYRDETTDVIAVRAKRVLEEIKEQGE